MKLNNCFRRVPFLLSFFLFTLTFTALKAQSIEELLDSYIDDNAKGYLQPLGELISTNIHTGIHEWSWIDSSFYVSVGINVMNTWPSSKMKTFTGKTGLGFEPEQTATVPTIIGKNEAVAVEGVNGTYFVFPVGYNSKVFPFAVPQLTLGGIYHTELSGRYFGFDLEDDFGRVSFFGIGLRHSLNRFFPSFPFDVSVGYFYQKFKTGSYVLNKNHFVAGHIGKSSKWWSTQLTLGYLNSMTDYEYSYVDDDITKTYHESVQGRFPFLAELNGSLHLWIITLSGAVAYNGPFSASLGLYIKL